ncbi:cyclic nucleotide-binding domain protein [Mariprofundus micogutta]|uniref:Cyclic nucleotide-binding domain protein n=1 Tax=Mariprofundus micogutta TaxID=1921010 RepID=A0A1L8CKQ9_9PROT|nr:cyclic nucleotide-binding domain-containing protein [Mariprofundus micogutta]GAV19490.1 cyclic nucleotide-binding domain protein [Mariprofundus micogutta]
MNLDQHCAIEACMAVDPLYTRFRGMPVCQELQDDECMMLYSSFDLHHIKAGTLIYKAHSPTDSTMRLILKGTVNVTNPDSGIDTTLAAGEMFGLFSFLDNERLHTASLIALSDVTLLSINRHYFNLITIENPSLGNLLLRFMFRLLTRMSLKMEHEYVSVQQYMAERGV